VNIWTYQWEGFLNMLPGDACIAAAIEHLAAIINGPTAPTAPNCKT
jgi:hypothetical protein